MNTRLSPDEIMNRCDFHDLDDVLSSLQELAIIGEATKSDKTWRAAHIHIGTLRDHIAQHWTAEVIR